MKITIEYKYDVKLPECARYVARTYLNGELERVCRESFEAARKAIIQHVKDIKPVKVPPPEEVEVEL